MFQNLDLSSRLLKLTLGVKIKRDKLSLIWKGKVVWSASLHLSTIMRFYYDKNLKYTNRQIISNLDGLPYAEKEYVNIDSADTINGHIIYQLNAGEEIPTYIFDEENNKRWYVSGITQLRTGKFQISLIRDIISEGDLEWKNEQAYISAGKASDYNRYKIWGLPFTNTKTEEQPVVINGSPSYFVFYTNTQSISSEGEITETDLKLSSVQVPSGSQVNVVLDSLDQYENYSYLCSSPDAKDNLLYLKWATTMQVFFTFGGGSDVPENYKYATSWVTNDGEEVEMGAIKWGATLSANEEQRDSIYYQMENPHGGAGPYFPSDSTVVGIFNDLQSDYQESIAKQVGAKKAVSKSKYYELNNDSQKLFFNKSTNKTYRLVKKEDEITAEFYPEIPSGSNMILTRFCVALSDYIRMSGKFSEMLKPSFIRVNTLRKPEGKEIENSFVTKGATRGDKFVYYYFEEVETASGFSFNFKSDSPKLPKSAVRCVNITSAGQPTITDKELGQALMQMSANTANLNNDTGQIIDIQYLPFSVATTTNDNILLNGKAMTAEFLNLDDYFFTITNQKLTEINKETDTIRLVSPSRATQFVFSPYNNDGNLDFEFKATIRPFSTIMYLRPHTTGLLLEDFDDKNCLIIEEDFSLTLLSSEWSNYVRQNRNYMNTFNREVQGREFERTWERRIEQAQAKSDEWTARNISAQKAQAYTGNLPIISGIAGAIGTAWKDSAYMEAAQLDREYNEAMYQESLSLAKDMFNYQIENIKSQPTTPSKITTIDCKFMGYIIMEFWSTNPTEKLAINMYYAYNGDRIDTYGRFADYWGRFVRGKIIISNYYTQPELNELNRRLQAGIFTGGN